MNKITSFFRLARFDKPIGILLLLWPTMSALWLASNGFPDANILVAFIFGVVVMRSAGCVINDLADADIDKHVERTRKRPLATGELSTKEALVFLLFLLSIALCLAISLGLKVVMWSLGGLILTIIYPFCKRFIKSPGDTGIDIQLVDSNGLCSLWFRIQPIYVFSLGWCVNLDSCL